MNSVHIPLAHLTPTRVTASSATVSVKPMLITTFPDDAVRKTALATVDLDLVDMLEHFCAEAGIAPAITRAKFGEARRWVEARDEQGIEWADFKKDGYFVASNLVLCSHTDAVDAEGNPTPDGKLRTEDGEEVFRLMLELPTIDVD